MVAMASQIPAAWGAAIEAYERHLRAGGAPATTTTTRRQQLNRLARTLGAGDPWSVSGEQLVAWAAAQPWAVETRRSVRTTLRSFYRWAAEGGLVEVSPAVALPVVRPSPPRPRPTPDQVYEIAMAAGDARERLILRLAAEAGLRRAEIAQVHSRDLVEDLTGWSLVVHGKGGKTRVLPLPPGLGRQLRALPQGWAFPGDDHGHLSPRWVGKLANRLLVAPWTIHSLRHRFAARVWVTSGADLFVVQELLGHASPVTTRVYVPVTGEKMRAAVEAAA